MVRKNERIKAAPLERIANRAKAKMEVEGLPLKLKFSGKSLPSLENLPERFIVKLGLFRNMLDNPLFQQQLGLDDYWKLTRYVPASPGERNSKGIFTSKSQLWTAIKLLVDLHYIHDAKVSSKKVLYCRGGETVFIERNGSLIDSFSRWYLDLRLRELQEHQTATRVPDFYSLLDQMDTIQMIEEEMSLHPTTLFYNFGSVVGNNIVAVSYAGLLRIRSEFAREGNPISVVKSEVKLLSNSYRAIIQSTDCRNRKIWASADEPLEGYSIGVEFNGREIDLISMLRTLRDPIL